MTAPDNQDISILVEALTEIIDGYIEIWPDGIDEYVSFSYSKSFRSLKSFFATNTGREYLERESAASKGFQGLASPPRTMTDVHREQLAQQPEGVLEQAALIVADEFYGPGVPLNEEAWDHCERAAKAILGRLTPSDQAGGAQEGGQDRKFRYDVALGQFVNRMSGEPIPKDEPIVIFRARDNHILSVLKPYLFAVQDAHHKAAVNDRIEEVVAYRQAHPERLKEPGVTRHILLNDEIPSDQGASHD